METSSARMRLRRGYHGQEQVSLPLRAEIQRYVSAKQRLRPVGGVVVDERPAAAHRILHVRERRRLAAVLIVPAAYRQRDAVARRHHDAGRPDLDVELVDLSGDERLFLV